MKQVTLCFLIRENQVLLAAKKRGFGQGWWNGPGGKVEKGETIEQAAIRETQEEISVTPLKLIKVAQINFYFEGKKDWDQLMHTYLVPEWEGEPKESEEMRPQWFELDKLPLDKMWPADDLWIPKVLAGKIVKGSVTFNDKKELMNYNFQEVKNVN